jgi:hypothetical protein
MILSPTLKGLRFRKMMKFVLNEKKGKIEKLFLVSLENVHKKGES